MTVGGISTFSDIVHFPPLPRLELNELSVTGVSTFNDVNINSSIEAGISTFLAGIDFGNGVGINTSGANFTGIAVTIDNLDLSGTSLDFSSDQNFLTTSGISTFLALDLGRNS